MPSIHYMNQSAPFWDWVANLEGQETQHPVPPFGNRGFPQFIQGFPFGGMPVGGLFDSNGFRNAASRPQPQSGERSTPVNTQAAASQQQETTSASEKPATPSEGTVTPGVATPESEAPPHHDHPHDGPHHHGPPHHGHPHDGPHQRGPPHCGRGRRHGPGPFGGRGGWGGPRGGPRDFPQGFDMGAMAEFFQNQLFGNQARGQENEAEAEAPAATSTSDFKPEADVFDTESAFVVHLSLPGARKEDLGVNWDPEKSELSVAGVIHRPGDEDFLKTLALNERKVGAFERKVRLGSRANPAQVDVDAITAKLEDGILRIDVPKLDRDYVEIKRVDIE